MVRIDAHQHFWNPSRGDYDWMPRDNPTLFRSYGPEDLAPALAESGVEYTVLVQAAATVNETEYMLGIADATPHVAAVVGWVDFENPDHLVSLERLAQHPKFVGVRPMIQDIADDNWMLRDDIQWGFRAVSDLNLTFDALGFPRHIPNFLTILKRYPEMRVVVDHCMKPDISAHSHQSFQIWADGMARIAQETSASCKFSGLITEANENWTVDDLRPYSDHVINVFGAARIMWGSDWPVCRLRSEYAGWRATADELTSGLSSSERDRVFGGTANEFYRLQL